MTRKNFIKNIATLGIATPFMASLLTSCNKGAVDFFESVPTNFNGKIIIVGAGAAGLIAGHILQQNNIDFQIIEASSIYGGRVKKAADFADFPIDLGGEWIEVMLIFLSFYFATSMSNLCSRRSLIYRAFRQTHLS